jgi:hypothetical protein
MSNYVQHNDWQTGDILAFSGEGRTSLTIRLATCSAVSHVGCVSLVPAWQLRDLAGCRVVDVAAERLATWHEQPLLFESTTLVDLPCAITGRVIEGVQAHAPQERVERYNGRVWRYRLTDAWRETFLEVDGPRRLTGHLLARIGTQYDGRGAILAGTRIIKHWWAWSRADRSSLFCSEYLASVLQHVGLFPISNASQMTPASLIRTLVADEIYGQPVLVKG